MFALALKCLFRG